MSRFIESGSYGCIYHPPYDCKGKDLKDTSLITKLVKNNFSSKNEYAVDAFSSLASDYLVKPIPLPRFIKCISKITGEFQNRLVVKQENHRVEPHIFIKVDKLQELWRC